jgi:hypothetical protein
LFEEFVEASDLSLSCAAARWGQSVVTATAFVIGFGLALTFTNFDDQFIFEEALDEAV